MAAAAALGHTAVALAAKRLPVHLWSYLGTQAAHVMVIVAVLLWMPGAFANGLWGAYAHTIAPIAVMLGGVISATLMGGPAVGLLMAPGAPPHRSKDWTTRAASSG